jgi:hypothetical protein
MYYLCLYNLETKEIDAPREISETALLTEEVPDHPMKDDLLHPWLKELYEREAISRGVPWTSYFSDKEQFTWEAYEAERATKE